MDNKNATTYTAVSSLPNIGSCTNAVYSVSGSNQAWTSQSDVVTVDWMQEHFFDDLEGAYKLVLVALKGSYPNRAEEFDTIYKLGGKNARYAVLCIEKELMKEEAKKLAALAE